MRWLALVVLSGCLLGAGPVVAVRTNGTVAIGGDATGTIFGVGGRTGVTVGFDGKAAGYLGATGVVPLYPRPYDRGDDHTGLGGMLGVALSERDTDLFAGIFPEYTRGDRGACEARMYTIQAGLRRVGKFIEFFVLPAVNKWHALCAD